MLAHHTALATDQDASANHGGIGSTTSVQKICVSLSSLFNTYACCFMVHYIECLDRATRSGTPEILSRKHVVFDQGLDVFIFLQENRCKNQENNSEKQRNIRKHLEHGGNTFKKPLKKGRISDSKCSYSKNKCVVPKRLRAEVARCAFYVHVSVALPWLHTTSS